MRAAFLGLAAVLLAAPALAGKADAALDAGGTPAAVKAYIADLDRSCADFGGTPNKSPTLMKWADLNGDGVTDYVVDVGAYDCGGAASAMSNGQSGSTVVVFAGGKDGSAVKAYQGSVYGITISEGDKPVMSVNLSGADCGQNTDDVSFSNWKSCTRALRWNAGSKSFAFGPLSEAKPVE